MKIFRKKLLWRNFSSGMKLKDVKSEKSYEHFFENFLEESEKNPEKKSVMLIRHGESKGNLRNLVYGVTDYGLTETGKQQAKALSKTLRHFKNEFESINSSALERAFDTMKIGLEEENNDLEHKKNSDFNEFNFGPFEDLSLENCSRFEKDHMISLLLHGRVHKEGIETPETVLGRVKNGIDSLKGNGPHLVFGHSGVIQFIGNNLGIRDIGDIHSEGELGIRYLQVFYCGGIGFHVGEDGEFESLVNFYSNLE